MLDLLIAAISGLLALALLSGSALIVLASGRTGLAWVYLACVAAVLGARWSRVPKSPGAALTRRIRNRMVSLCLALAAGAAVAFVGYGMASRPPKQQAVAAILSEHRAELERLRDMVTADRLESILHFGEDFSRPAQPSIFKTPAESGLTPERAAEYKHLMKAVGAERVDVWPDETVHMSVAAWGAANRGWRMSLVWSASEPRPLMPSLDGFPGTKPPGTPDHAYSRLDGAWYVYMIR